MDEREPLLTSSQRRTPLDPIPEHSDEVAVSVSEIVPHHDHEDQARQEPHHEQERDSELGTDLDPAVWRIKRKLLRRSRTAPAMAVIQDLKSGTTAVPKPETFSNSMIKQAFFLLFVYLSLGIVTYYLNREHYKVKETHPVVDALYFCVVTMCTIGYGDITPLTPTTKLLAVVFVLFGFGFVDILLSGVVNQILDEQESMILTGIKVNSSKNRKRFSARDYIVDVEKGRMRIRLKVGLALCIVVLCIGIGVLALYHMEHLDWLDSVYLSVMSVTTVGYGDKAFNTLEGRAFAALWLLFSTLAVARAFLYLAEARVDKRHRMMAKWVLDREITVDDLLAADINHNGFMSKSEYVIYKLKEMGKVEEKDIMQISNQFRRFDPRHSGKIKLADLLSGQ